MLEYGIKTVTTNPTLITKADEIIKLVDNKTKKVRAFVIPATYATYVEKISKELEYKKWAKDKKKALKEKTTDGELEDLSSFGMQNIQKYLGDSEC